MAIPGIQYRSRHVMFMSVHVHVRQYPHIVTNSPWCCLRVTQIAVARHARCAGGGVVLARCSVLCGVGGAGWLRWLVCAVVVVWKLKKSRSI